MANNKNGTPNTPTCSFCGKPLAPTAKAISGMYATICEDCIRLAGSMMDAKKPVQEQQTPKKAAALPSPHKIKEHLDQFVIGQDKAKEALSIAVQPLQAT